MIHYSINPVRLVRHLYRLFFLVVVFTISFVAGSYCQAAFTDHADLLSPEVVYPYGREEIKSVQINLRDIGYDPREIDGLVGPHTRAAVKRFFTDFEGVICCDSFEDLRTVLMLLAAVAPEEPQWKTRILAPGFLQWVVKEQPGFDSRACRIWTTLTPFQLLGFFESYHDQDLLGFERTADYIVSYQLTEADLEKLKSEEDLLGRLKKLADKPFAGRKAFLDAVRDAAAFKDPDDDYSLQSLLQDTSAAATHTLTEDSLSKLKEAPIPEGVIEALAPLQDVEYADQNAFDQAVQPILDDLHGQVSPYRTKILKAAAEGPQVCTLSRESLAELQDDLPAELLTPLKALEGQVFESKKALEASLREIVAQISKDCACPVKTPEELILEKIVCQKGYRITEAIVKQFADKGMPDYLLSLLRQFTDLGIMTPETFTAKLEARLDYLPVSWRNKIDAQVNYRLTEQGLAQLDHAPLSAKTPDALIEWLQTNLLDIDYANKHLFESALQAKLDRLMQGYRETVRQVLENRGPTQLPADVREQLKAELDEKGLPYDPQQLENQVDRLGRDKTAQESALQDEIKTPVDVWKSYGTKITTIARKERLFASDRVNRPMAIDWQGESCGCVLDDLSETTVYGFYPFWLSGNQDDAPPEAFSFSVLSRIGYYAQPVDKNGKLTLNSGWQFESNAAFIKAAHKYRTRVDLVIYGIDWPQLIMNKPHAEIAGALADLVENRDIDVGAWTRFLLTTFPWHWFDSNSKLKSVVGITIDFEGYPADPDAVEAFMGLITALDVKLREANPRYKINIMLPLERIGRDIFSYANLEHMMAGNEGTSLIDSLLVFIDEPTTDSKKTLRRKIENHIRGQARIDVLRKIIPVVTFSGGNPDLKDAEIDTLTDQLKDDIRYSQYNFGGIGFWPVPRMDMKGSQAVEAALQEIFRARHANQNIFKEAATRLCNWVCPHRGYFRIAADIIILLVVVLFIRIAASCKTRLVLEQNKKYFIGLLCILALLVLLVAALLYCDPYYQKMREGNLPLLALVLIVFVLSIWQYRRHVRQRQNP